MAGRWWFPLGGATDGWRRAALEFGCTRRYHGGMETPLDKPRPAPQAWVDTLARARADVAAGRTHRLADVLRDLDGDIAGLEDEARLQADRPEPAQAHGPRTGQ